MQFSYSYTRQATNDIEIDDIGNCNIVAYNDNADEYYLKTNTIDGWTTVVDIGPVTPDLEPMYFSVYYKKLEFSEKKIGKMISDFLNNPAKNINQVTLVDNNEMYNAIHDIWRYIDK